MSYAIAWMGMAYLAAADCGDLERESRSTEGQRGWISGTYSRSLQENDPHYRLGIIGLIVEQQATTVPYEIAASRTVE
jgi:hypothetical protein